MFVVGAAYGHQRQLRAKRVLFASAWQMEVSTLYNNSVAVANSSARVDRSVLATLAQLSMLSLLLLSIFLIVGHTMLNGGKA